MSQVVQARCPHCQNVLRVPAEWLGRTMRCKHCQNTFQAKAPAAEVKAAVPVAKAPAAAKPAAPKAAPAAAVVTPPPPTPAPRRDAGDPFSFDDEDEAVVATAPRKKGNALLFAGLGLALLLALLGGGAAVLLVASGWLAPNDADGVAPIVDDGGGGIKPVPAGNPDLLPRRALLLNVNNYLYLNAVHYGSPRADGYPGSSTLAFADQLQRPPMKFPASQIFEVSDGSPKPHVTERTVLRAAIQDFLEASRAQDRVVLVFCGHATDLEKKSYLIPIAGKVDDAETLIPLDWVLGELARCKARQKVLILDVFRFAPGLGFELPGAGASEEGEMGEDFEENLKTPPAGVQVWVACSKGQRSLEGASGSHFMQALNNALQTGPAMTGFIDGNDPLPIDDQLVAKVNQRLKELAAPQKFEQVSRLTGSPLPSGAPFDPSEPPPPALVKKQPEVPGGAQAGYASINSILNEIRMLPPVRQTRVGEDRLLQAANLPPFPAKVIEEYQPDGYKFLDEIRDDYKKDPKGFYKRHPIRAAVFEAVEALEKSNKLVLREEVSSPISPQDKKSYLAEQREPGLAIFELEQVLGRMQSLEEDLEKEPSKRWRANFEFTMNRLKSRLVYIYEYSFILGQIRRDEMPELAGNQNGWSVGSRKKAQVNETKVRTYTREIRQAWNRIQEHYPDTPYAALAYRESLIALGLEWRGKSQ